jgi:hypothetical protein
LAAAAADHGQRVNQHEEDETDARDRRQDPRKDRDKALPTLDILKQPDGWSGMRQATCRRLLNATCAMRHATCNNQHAARNIEYPRNTQSPRNLHATRNAHPTWNSRMMRRSGMSLIAVIIQSTRSIDGGLRNDTPSNENGTSTAGKPTAPRGNG